jgi:curved DNA-binding protein CbpA
MIPKPEPDPYAVLGVAPTATEAEIRAAYRALVAKYHPDRHQGNPLEDLAAAKVAEINRAYETLSDPERRAAYDRGRSSWPRPVASPFATAPGGARKRSRWMLVVGLLMLLPLLLRFGAFVVRMLVHLFRLASEGFALVRGTPAAMVGMALAVTLFILLLVHRRRRRLR